jgi:hypothetical protein
LKFLIQNDDRDNFYMMALKLLVMVIMKN